MINKYYIKEKSKIFEDYNLYYSLKNGDIMNSKDDLNHLYIVHCIGDQRFLISLRDEGNSLFSYEKNTVIPKIFLITQNSILEPDSWLLILPKYYVYMRLGEIEIYNFDNKLCTDTDLLKISSVKIDNIEYYGIFKKVFIKNKHYLLLVSFNLEDAGKGIVCLSRIKHQLNRSNYYSISYFEGHPLIHYIY